MPSRNAERCRFLTPIPPPAGNVFVWCEDSARCGSACWLKRLGRTEGALVQPHASGVSVPWRSGVLPAKAEDVDAAALPAPPEKGLVVVTTVHGAIRLRLRPDLSPESVAYVRLLAQYPRLCTSACAFYRVEPGFLLQGSLRARVPPNAVTKPGPIMHRGDVGWAGGSAGPDWFIYLGALPATHWGSDHTVWAEAADNHSLAVADFIAALKPAPTKPGDMHLLATQLALDLAWADK